jgi:hypothetical protein
LVQKTCNGLVVLGQGKGILVLDVVAGCHHAFVQAADSQDSMLDGGLSSTYLQHKNTPKDAVEIAG